LLNKYIGTKGASKKQVGQNCFRLSIMIPFVTDRVLTMPSVDYFVQEGTGKLRKVH